MLFSFKVHNNVLSNNRDANRKTTSSEKYFIKLSIPVGLEYR